jgi:hypothetical protein
MIDGCKDLQGGFFFLAAFAGGLLIGFVGGHLFIEITFTVAAAGWAGAIDAKIFGDIIPVDLVFEDQAPFAEGLKRHQQDQ